MNILMVSDVYFPRVNGVSTSIETFRRSLHQQGVRSTLIAPAYPGGGADDDGVLRIPSRFVPLDPEDRMMRSGHIAARADELAGEGFDLIHIHTPFVAHYAGLALARKLRLPCVATYHTFFEEYLFHYVPTLPRSWLRALARRFSRTQCNALHAVIVPSRAMAAALLDYGVERPLEILPTGIPPDQFQGGDGRFFRSRYEIPADARLLLFVGRVAHEKNIGFLIEMIDHLRHTEPRALLLITGEGPALATLRNAVAQRGLERHVRFLGYLDRHSELHDCYRAADLFVFASRTETQGLVLLEAMALGTPVVALAQMGTCDILEGETGCRIGPDDPAAFAALVASLLSRPELLERLAGEARQRARHWHADDIAARLVRLYARWIDASGSPRRVPALTAGSAGRRRLTSRS
ncbi:glycosyltransferase [Azoarcus olearius]|uniref:glycosyltransferase n=1 Tax=Azoarcus sp. (strain BH72) TaxID=418699 RepID=UPI000806130C|nr:glycosyltransferase [Azoarcus olearius]ANQ84104.1 glycosyltransferase [Azoarcus olearius]